MPALSERPARWEPTRFRRAGLLFTHETNFIHNLNIYENEKKTTNNAPGPRGNDDAHRSVGAGRCGYYVR